jgi:lipopolysaccharide/colanic/teichoic acid biosynthesis glycosyltransferase
MTEGVQSRFKQNLDKKIRQVKRFTCNTTDEHPSSLIRQDDNQAWLGCEVRSFSTAIYHITKRLIDITVAGLGLILSLPLMVIITVLIILDTPGPFIFRQKRIGKNRRYHSNGHLSDRRNGDLKGQPFNMYKFRTMRHEVAHYAISPQNGNDRRLTRVGRIIRSTCLDELPQLFNVLKGDMTLVGPRPEMPFIVKNYNQLESLRLAVKPGITGLWQLYGSREQQIHENLQYDLDYIKNRSLSFDLKIMLKTISFVFRSKNV